MGRVQAQGGSSSSPSSTLLHFSHPHRLDLTTHQSTDLIRPICSACTLQITSPTFYACRPCNFFLDTTCSRFVRQIQHPSHPQHILSLLPSPAYPSFNCDACGIKSTSGFTYHCQTCEIDIHCLCAALPFVVSRPDLHLHKLDLVYSPPYHGSNEFSCDVCSRRWSSQWLYRCKSCEFDVHIKCATNGSHPPPNRCQSFPISNSPQQQQQQVRVVGGVPAAGIPVVAGNGGQLRHSQSLLQQPTYNRQAIQQPQVVYLQQAGASQPGSNSVMDGFVNQVVSGAGQQLGQNLVNAVFGGGAGAGAGFDIGGLFG